MKRKMIPLLTLLLVAVMCITLASCGEEEEKNEFSNYTFTPLPDGTYEISGIGQSVSLDNGNLSIPKTYNGVAVTSIGKEAFRDCSSLTSITIPDSVTSIGDYAFYGCESLTSITIPDGVTRIGKGAFYNCSSLTYITIPDGVTRIGDNTFYGCESLTYITIPYGVTRIGDSAFGGCTGLTSITIPDSVTSIGLLAFSGCESPSVYYTGTAAEWKRLRIYSSYDFGLAGSTIYYFGEP